jgi:N-acetylneuraminate lyase
LLPWAARTSLFHHDMKNVLTGLIAAPHTPFHPDGSIAYDVIPRQARLLAQNGVAGAFICGTTGEGASRTSDERRRVVEAWGGWRPSPPPFR